MKFLSLILAIAFSAQNLQTCTYGQEPNKPFPKKIEFELTAGLSENDSMGNVGVRAIARLDSEKNIGAPNPTCYLVKDRQGNTLVWLPKGPQNEKSSLDELERLLKIMVLQDELKKLVRETKQSLETPGEGCKFKTNSADWLEYKKGQNKVLGTE